MDTNDEDDDETTEERLPWKKKRKQLHDVFFRSAAQAAADGQIYHNIILSGTPGVVCDLKIQAGTDNGTDELNLKEVKSFEGTTYRVVDGLVEGLTFDKKGKIALKVIFEDNERYSLNIVAYENK